MLSRFIFFVLLSFPFQTSATSQAPVTQSMVDAVERRLSVEQAPAKRMQLLLRWISFKDELANEKLTKVGAEGLKNHKREIVERLQAEIPGFEKVRGEYKEGEKNLNTLYRELSNRQLQSQNYQAAIEAFLKINPRTADDEMGLGDAYFGLGQTLPAMNAFERAARDSKLVHIAAYKRAWAYMRLADFPKALEFFNEALKENPLNPVNLKEEAFKDRIRPFIETHRSEEFSALDFTLLKALAENTFSDMNRRQTNLVAALERLIEGFNAKNQIKKSREAFAYLSRESKDPTAVLLQSAPLWLRVYRGQLDHERVVGILKELPQKDLSTVAGTSELKAELNNTAVFYETLLEEEKIAKTEKVVFYRGILLELYRRYFIAFRKDTDSDSLRISYAQHLIQDGDAGACLSLLAERSGKEEKIEEVAKNLEGKCELKYIDQLYLKEHNEFFFSKIEEALLRKKIYAREDLGVSKEQAFEGLARMLVGSLKKNPSHEKARRLLAELSSDFPMSKALPIFTELKTLAAELSFQDLTESAKPNDESSNQFFEIYSGAPKGSEVAQKALQNAVLSGNAEATVQYCKSFRTEFPKLVFYNSDLFKKCLLKAEEFHDLDEEYIWLGLFEEKLSVNERLRLGLLEMALRKGPGRKRLVGLNTAAARVAISLWEGEEAPRVSDDRVDALVEAQETFTKSLKRIRFADLQREVPARVRDFDFIDRKLVALYKQTKDAKAQAKLLELRALIAVQMKDWMRNLPEPPGVKGEDLEKYRAGAAQILQPWEDGALARVKECSELAYSLSEDVKDLDPRACPEAVSSEIQKRFMDAWQMTRKSDREPKSPRVRALLEKSRKTSDRWRAQLFLLRALESVSSEVDKSFVFLALAEKTGHSRFWRQAGELNGSLKGPIEWRLRRSEGNPFFRKLYQAQLDQL